MMQFETVGTEQAKALAALWREAFEEDGETIVPLLLEAGQGFCCRDGDEILAMAFALPYAVATNGAVLDCRYLYGVATAKQYRGQGIATRLLDSVEQEMKRQGAEGLLLVPADAELFSFYEKRGYRVWSYGNRARAEADEPCDAAEYLRLRGKYLNDRAYVFPPQEIAERCAFFKGADGCRAVIGGKTAEALPPVQNGAPYAAAKKLSERFPDEGFFSFAMDE